jgi:phage gpG-like protein
LIEYEVIDSIPDVELETEKMWDDIGQYMVLSIQKTIDEGGRPGKWPPPKREALFTSGTQLKRSGDLYNSGTYRTEGAGVTIAFGAGLPYAWIQNFGGTTHPVVSEKMKRFFLFMGIQTEDPFWFVMAAKPVGEVLNITIPARTYMTIQPEDKEFIRDRVKSSIILVYPDGKIETIQ